MPVKPVTTFKRSRAEEREITERVKTVQNHLKELGFYDGEIDGLQQLETNRAILEFKRIYQMPENISVTEGFVADLDQIIKDRNDSAILLDQPAPVTSTPGTVVFDTAPETSTQTSGGISEEAVIVGAVAAYAGAKYLTSRNDDAKETPKSSTPYQAEEKKVASLVKPNTRTAAPEVRDIVIPAKMIDGTPARYPERAERAGKNINAVYMVAVDIRADGSVTNARIIGTDYDGGNRFEEDFERAALTSARSQIYKPRTVNGKPVKELERHTRIIFNLED